MTPHKLASNLISKSMLPPNHGRKRLCIIFTIHVTRQFTTKTSPKRKWKCEGYFNFLVESFSNYIFRIPQYKLKQ